MKNVKLSSNILECNLEHFRRLTLILSSSKGAVLHYHLDPYKYKGFGSLQIKAVKNNLLQIVDSTREVKSMFVSLDQYTAITFTWKDAGMKKNKTFNILLNQDYSVRFYTSVWNNATPKKTTTLMPRKTTLGSSNKVINHQALVERFAKNPFVVKKSKFRFRLKAYWTKRSDFARSHWSRSSRVLNLNTGMTDFKWRKSFSLKFRLLKFLYWKLGITPKMFRTFIGSYHTVNSNSHNVLSTFLLNRLASVLVLSHLFPSHTNAEKAIQQGQVLINGLVVKNNNYVVKTGDLVSFAPSLWYSLQRYLLRMQVLPSINWYLNTENFNLVILNVLHADQYIIKNQEALLAIDCARNNLKISTLNNAWMSLILRYLPVLARS
jgi:ribosomal protein S4